MYEMRIYHAAPGKRAELSARFKNHTRFIQKKWGIEDVASFTSADDPDIYVSIVKHPTDDIETIERNWAEFQASSEWQAVVAESDANGPLVAPRGDGWAYDIFYLTSTPYSPLDGETETDK